MKFVKNNNDQFNENLISELATQFDLNSDIIKLLFSRGINTENKIRRFLSPEITDLHNPFLLKNMREVVDKINSYISKNKHIVVVGDYDTDGISASAIMYLYFKSICVSIDVFLPQRMLDGYGLTIETIDRINDLYRPDLIITVDCGISSVKEVEYCKSKGIDIIITDHHDIPDEIPDTLVIDAKLPNQMYPFSEICGAGVALKLVQAMSNLETALDYVPIASLATIADIVPLVDENRAIVYYGLKNFDKLPKGIKRLCNKLGIKNPNSSDISFKLSPKLNAPGRMGDAKIAYNIYVNNDDEIINENIEKLLQMNDDRVYQTNKIYEECLAMLDNICVSEMGAIVLYKDDWEGGVLGIICSKLVDKFNKPVCLLSLNDNEYKGSVRSIPNINIYNILNEIKDIMIRFGGHNQAGGLSVTKANIDKFSQAFNDTILSHYSFDDFVPSKKYDLILSDDIDLKYMQQLNLLEPFGSANEKPVFLMNLNKSKFTKLCNFPQHIKIRNSKFDIMAFNMGEYYGNLISNCSKQALVELNLEQYKNKQVVKGIVKAFSFSALNGVKKGENSANYLSQLNYINNNNNKTINNLKSFDDIENLLSQPFGTCVITYDYDKYKRLSKMKNILNYEMYSLNDQTGINTLIFAPYFDQNFNMFSNIVLLEMPLCDGFYSCFNNNIFVFDGKYNLCEFRCISTSRNVFAIYHNAIKTAICENVDYNSDIGLFEIAKKVGQSQNLDLKQFIFVLMVLCELGILKRENNKYVYTDVKSQLTSSAIYNNVSLLTKIGV